MPDTDESAARDRVPVSLLQRRGIEAEVLVPFIRRLERELGVERAHALARETIAEIAREQGAAVAAALGRDDLAGFHEVRDSWGGAGGDLTIEPVAEDATHLAFNVTRCRFAELYQQLGARDLGFALSCARDFTLSEGYSPRLRLERTQTIMQGAPFCDFRYTYAPPNGGPPMADTAPEERPDPHPEDEANHGDEEATRAQSASSGPRVRRGTGIGFGGGADANEAAKDAFTARVQRAADAARAALERGRPAAERAANDALGRAEDVARAARPHIEHAAHEAADFAREHQDEIKSAAVRAARIAARLTIPRNVRDAFEEELHRGDASRARGDEEPRDPGTPGATR